MSAEAYSGCSNQRLDRFAINVFLPSQTLVLLLTCRPARDIGPSGMRSRHRPSRSAPRSLWSAGRGAAALGFVVLQIVPSASSISRGSSISEPPAFWRLTDQSQAPGKTGGPKVLFFIREPGHATDISTLACGWAGVTEAARSMGIAHRVLVALRGR